MNTAIPHEMKAVFHIFNSNQELRTKALPFLNLEARKVDWYEIGKQHFGRGHLAAILWAKCLWFWKLPKDPDMMELSTSMDFLTRKTVIEAIQISWGLLEE